MAFLLTRHSRASGNLADVAELKDPRFRGDDGVVHRGDDGVVFCGTGGFFVVGDARFFEKIDD